MPAEPDVNVSAEVAAGAAVYSKLLLAVYDLEVLGFELPVIFKCPSRRIVEHYERHLSERHLDVGVGTGYFLDRARFPVASPELHLLDLNANCLERTAARVRRYRPVSHRANVLAPIAAPLPRFGSIAMTNLLHCLPGTMAEKGRAFGHLKPFLREGGTLFGVTVLGKGVDGTGAAYRWANRAYNRKAIFTNLQDGPEELDAALGAHFPRRTVEVVGAMGFFVAQG